MSFHKQSFSHRFGAMGDEAEAIFDLVYPKHHKLGLNRPPFGMARMPPVARYVPDRMTNKAFWEVQGLGRDRLLKFKQEKLDALHHWDQLDGEGKFGVRFFIWDKTAENVYEGTYKEWDDACRFEGEPDTYPEGKVYYALHVDDFPTEPRPLESLVQPDLQLQAA